MLPLLIVILILSLLVNVFMFRRLIAFVEAFQILECELCQREQRIELLQTESEQQVSEIDNLIGIVHLPAFSSDHQPSPN